MLKTSHEEAVVITRSPDITEIVLRARSTRIVRMAVKFAMFGAIVTYL